MVTGGAGSRASLLSIMSGQGSGFYRNEASLSRSLQSSFESSLVYPNNPLTQQDCIQSRTHSRPHLPAGPHQWQPSPTDNSINQLFTKLDEMMVMISSTQQLVFDQQASQKHLEGKVAKLTRDLEEVSKQQTANSSAPDSGKKQASSQSRIPLELSVGL